MGMNTLQWRAAIGCWLGGNSRATCSFPTVPGNPPVFYALVLAALLLVGGVELNPGPFAKCRCELCGALYETLSTEVASRERVLGERESRLLELEKQLQEREIRVVKQDKLLERRESLVTERESSCNERELALHKRETLLNNREKVLLEREVRVLGRERGNNDESRPPGSEISEASHQENSVRERGDDVVALPSPDFLLEVASCGNLGAVQKLLRVGVVSVEHRDSCGKTALIRAAERGHLAMVRYLLQIGGADITARDLNGDTALHRAAQSGHHQTVQYLVKAGAKRGLCNNRGQAALNYSESGAQHFPSWYNSWC